MFDNNNFRKNIAIITEASVLRRRLAELETEAAKAAKKSTRECRRDFQRRKGRWDDKVWGWIKEFGFNLDSLAVAFYLVANGLATNDPPENGPWITTNSRVHILQSWSGGKPPEGADRNWQALRAWSDFHDQNDMN